MDKRKVFRICVILFAISAGVRLVVWQNNKAAMAAVQSGVTTMYLADAGTLLSGDLKTFLAGPNPPSDANILTHPPGYPMVIALGWGIFGSPDAFLVIQILLNSLAPAFVFLIVARLSATMTAVIAGSLVAVGPQFAYYSGIMLPDGLCVLPILVAVYALVRAVENPRLRLAILCGASLGVSCWLRSNAMLLPAFFCGFALFLLPKTIRVRFAFTLIAAFVLTIAPITIRNFVVFHNFIPLSLGMGHMIVIGMGDYDKAGQLGLPKNDVEEIEMEAAKYNRPDYRQYLYNSDGVERERARVRLGLETIKANPGWYATVVARRATMMFRMERVPVIAQEYDERETTPAIWEYLNIPLKAFQKLFITAVFLPLLLVGFVLLARDKQQRRTAMILGVVPLYYICFQSLIYTEYRFFVAVPHFVMMFGAVALSFVVGEVQKKIFASRKAP